MFGAIAARLRGLNAHHVGVFGLVLGGAAIIVPPVSAFFTLLSNPSYLVELAHALTHLYWSYKAHWKLPIPDNDQLVLAQLIGATIAIFGAFTVALICAFYGRASSKSNVPADAGQPTGKEG